MSGRQSWVRRKAEPQFVRQVRSKSETERSEMLGRFDLERVVPALLKRIAGAPRARVTEVWRARTWVKKGVVRYCVGGVCV